MRSNFRLLTGFSSFLSMPVNRRNEARVYGQTSSHCISQLSLGNSDRPEIKPYVISDLTTDTTATPPTDSVLDGDAGFDVKYAVTQGLTADFTYNTDFAQVEVDEQQVTLTRFSLFFPEKREFFLEGQGIFDFGGGRGFSGRGPGLRVGGSGGGASNTPILFFSRRIGLDEGVPVPIEAGGRLTGKVGAFSIGLLDIRTGGAAAAGARPTNFGVVRIKRDILRRSAIGVLATHRSVALSGEGSNQLYGVDGTFAFYDNLNLNTYLARTETPGLDGDDSSYRGQLDYSSDRYGVQVERLVVDEHFNPEVGFLRRTDFQRNFASARFSPRPASIASVRKLTWEGSFDYVTNGARPGRHPYRERCLRGRTGEQRPVPVRDVTQFRVSCRPVRDCRGRHDSGGRLHLHRHSRVLRLRQPAALVRFDFGVHMGASLVGPGRASTSVEVEWG